MSKHTPFSESEGTADLRFLFLILFSSLYHTSKQKKIYYFSFFRDYDIIAPTTRDAKGFSRREKIMGKRRIFRKILAVCLCLAALFVTACGDKDTNENSGGEQAKTTSKAQIKIATKNTPEQNVLAHLAQNLIEQKTELNAEVVYYDDSTSASLLERMENNDIQIFFDYSGSLAVNALEMEREDINPPTLLQDVQNTLNKKHGVSVSEEIGYSSTTALYMSIARRTELNSPSTLSEIAKMSPDLTIAMNEGFYTRIDCFEALCKQYGMEFKEAKVMDEERGFRALMEGDIDLYIADSVSPYLSLLDVKQLVDDQYFFLPQTTCCLVSQKALDKYPELEPALKNMEGLINTSRMSLMIRRIYWEGNDVDEYLYTYLRANNLI